MFINILIIPVTLITKTLWQISCSAQPSRALKLGLLIVRGPEVDVARPDELSELGQLLLADCLPVLQILAGC